MAVATPDPRPVPARAAGEGESWFLDEPATRETDEYFFDRQWAITVLERALSRLEEGYTRRGKAPEFQALRPFLTESGTAESYVTPESVHRDASDLERVDGGFLDEAVLGCLWNGTARRRRRAAILPIFESRLSAYRRAMPLTVEQILEETRTSSDDQLELLVHRLGDRLHDLDPQMEEAWRSEACRRLEEIESGKVQAIPLQESLARARKIAGL